MKLLLVVGTANDLIIYNYAKWLKKSIDVHIDVFEFFPNKNSRYGNEYYDEVASANPVRIKIGFLRSFNYFPARRVLEKFLEHRHYDAIHCHWLLPETITARGLKEHCNKLYATFWGGEYETMNMLHSHRAYLNALDRFLSGIDYMVNSVSENKKKLKIFPQLAGKQLTGYFGSSTLESLFKLMENESKRESKIYMNIAPDKYTVMIGYSGKRIHRHIRIISEVVRQSSNKDKIHFLVPMTRDASEKYIQEVESRLNTSGISYTLQKGGFLSDEEVARLRNATDITLQLSEYDGFSRSILEALCAGSILIYGDWLDYETHLNEKDLYAVSVSSINEGISKMDTVISDFSEFSERTLRNKEHGSRELWSECIQSWIDAYSLCK